MRKKIRDNSVLQAERNYTRESRIKARIKDFAIFASERPSRNIFPATFDPAGGENLKARLSRLAAAVRRRGDSVSSW